MKRSGKRRPRATMCRRPGPIPTRLEDPWYDATHQVRRVKETGQIRWQGDLIFVSEAVRGELSGSPKPSAAIGLSGSCTWNWAASIARRADLRRRGTAGGSDERRRSAAVEMPRPWKSQNDFHRRLEISHSTRDSHIPTADYSSGSEDEKRTTRSETKVLPMYPV